MKTIYCVGNLLLKEDNTPIKIMGKLQKQFPDIEFKELDPTEDIPEGTLTIIDTVVGIYDVKIIDDLDIIVSDKAYSLHDFDLGINLKLMKKAGKLDKVQVIGVPQDMTEEKALEEISKLLLNILS